MVWSVVDVDTWKDSVCCVLRIAWMMEMKESTLKMEKGDQGEVTLVSLPTLNDLE